MPRGTTNKVLRRVRQLSQLSSQYITLAQIARTLGLSPTQAKYAATTYLQNLFVKACWGNQCVHVTKAFWENAVREFPALLAAVRKRVFKAADLYDALCGSRYRKWTRKGYYTTPTPPLVILVSLAKTFGAREMEGYPGVFYITTTPHGGGEVKHLKALCKMYL